MCTPTPLAQRRILPVLATLIITLIVSLSAPGLAGLAQPAPSGSASAVTFEEMVSTYDARRVTFLAYLTPHTERITQVKLRYAFPSTGEIREANVPPPVQTLGETIRNPVRFTMGIEALPDNEDTVLYRWQVITESGAEISGPQETFRVTEVSNAEWRDDLPIIDAESSFRSEFPKQAVFTSVIRPDPAVQYARFYLTQNRGIVLHSFAVRAPTQNAGEPLTLSFAWNDQLGLQIPWQQFEWWWVVTDRNGRQWRTPRMFNDYEDATFHAWNRTETRHAVLFTYEQSAQAIQTLADATDTSIELLEQMYGYRLLYTPHIVVYNTPAHFQSWAPPEVTDEFIGLASGLWGGAVVTYWESIEFTGYAIIQHELVHLFQYQSIRDHAPKWWMEGSARYFERVSDFDAQTFVRAMSLAYGAPQVANGVQDLAPDKSGAWPYHVGSVFIGWFIDNFGEDAFHQMHVAMARDVRFPEALELVTGKTLRAVSDAFKAWLEDPSLAP
ncbi:MAG: hypothetical protein IT323_08610 [Anaerolineae bacterium]|nr:hypothetical protein [Anaerolineae bacterium]